jgi:hypothetical protein
MESTMKTIRSVFSHNSLKTKKPETNKFVRASKPLRVSSFIELVELIAKIAYRNRDYELFYRGQSQEYLNKDNESTILPSICRKDYPDWDAFSKLDGFVQALQEKEFRFEHDETFNQFNEVKWAILQHYEVCSTPLLDLTRSLRVACSFALEKTNQNGILYVFGLPYVHGSISFYVEAEFINLKLSAICPPQALRPQFQEGFLAGTFPPIISKIPSRTDYDVTKLDFNRRLVAKFELQQSTFWDEDFLPVPRDALFPKNDRVENICSRMKELRSK